MDPMMVAYVVTEGFCGIYALVVIGNLDDSFGAEQEISDLRSLVFTYLAFLASDMASMVVNGTYNLAWPLLGAVLNSISIMAVSLGCYRWYRYVEDRIHPFVTQSMTYRVVTTAPIIAVLVLVGTSVFSGLIFYIDEGGLYRTTDLFDYVPGVINFLYLTIPTIISLVVARRERSAQKRSEYITYSLFMFVALAAGLVEDSFPTSPILALSVFMVILITFLTIQNNQVYNDALTDMNNRRSLLGHLDEVLPHATEDNPVGLFMVDVDGLGQINHAHGHLEGDRVLRVVAQALKRAAKDLDAFAARYGGDEFCLVVTGAELSPLEVEERIRDFLAETIESQEGDCPAISVSMGYATCTSRSASADSLMQKADRQLGENASVTSTR